jgi:hypothetical protein
MTSDNDLEPFLACLSLFNFLSELLIMKPENLNKMLREKRKKALDDA